MPKVPFESAHLKVERAKTHIKDLNLKVGAFLALNPYKLVVEKDTKPGRWRVAFRERAIIPVEFSLIVGDAVHNLRVALDHLAVELVRLNGKSPKGVRFPFSINRDGLEDAIKKGHISRAGPKVVEIVKTLKPHHGGNEVLRFLHDLDVSDKHTRLMLVQSFSPGAGRQAFESRGAVIGELGLNIGMLKDGMTYMFLTALGNCKVGDEIETSCTICLREGDPFKFIPLLPVLDELTETVEKTLSEFEAVLV